MASGGGGGGGGLDVEESVEPALSILLTQTCRGLIETDTVTLILLGKTWIENTNISVLRFPS